MKWNGSRGTVRARQCVLPVYPDAPVGEVLLVTARLRRGCESLIEQLSSVGLAVTLIDDTGDAWTYLRAWRYIDTDLPRVAVIDASPLSEAGSEMFAQHGILRARPEVPMLVLVGSEPLGEAVPGMVAVPLPCRCQQVTTRVLRAAGLTEAQTDEILMRHRFWEKDRSDAWLPGSWQDEAIPAAAASDGV